MSKNPTNFCGGSTYLFPDLKAIDLSLERGFAASGGSDIEDAPSEDYGTL